MEFRKNSKYAIVAPTSMGLRMTPKMRQPVHISLDYDVQVTSAESNVLSVPAALGLRTKVYTKFVKDNPISKLIKQDLQRRNIAYAGEAVPQGGPWGYRHQINIADSGYGMRGPSVWNDRAGEIGATLSPEDFSMQQIFQEEGAEILLITGLIAAISEETGALCLAMARAAKENGTRVCFDLNHRPSFWAERETELCSIFREIVGLSDILVADPFAAEACLGLENRTKTADVAGQKEGAMNMMQALKAAYPSISYVLSSQRETYHANLHLWGALLWDGASLYEAPAREIPVLDRIGGGDGFLGGVLYGLLKGFTPEAALQFGWGAGAMAVTVFEDYICPLNEEEVWRAWQGNTRVKR